MTESTAAAKKRSATKKQRTEDPSPDDFMRLGRAIWSKDPTKANASSTEDRKFREFFGCGNEVACLVWKLLAQNDLVPNKGTMEHFMWTLLFMNLYAKDNTLASLADGKPDPKTFQKWVWQFIYALAMLETEVVSCVGCFARLYSSCAL